MRSIRIENLTKSYNGEVIFQNLNLTIPGGKFFALLGPSGCGKTTLLRLIGGFETPDSGKIYIGDEDITDKLVNQRHVNTVFQNYALFPHMTVYQNVAYSQVIRGISANIIKEKVTKILGAVNLQAHAHKYIRQLSGGQQQRVALARAIINAPEVLLLDEPLAALDVKLRERMLIELSDLQEKLGTTFVYITHDQLEALTVADQMAIMNQGKIEQVGTPKEIYEFPKTSFVAKFVGTTNTMHGVLTGIPDDPRISIDTLGEFSVYIPKYKSWMTEGARVVMGIRPEKILITKELQQGFSTMVKGIVESIVYHGRSTQYTVRLKNNERILVFEQNDEHFPQEVIDYDNHVYLYWQKENVILIER